MIQGSLHLWLTQAWLDEHSLLLVHSGLQYGGDPKKFGEHVQDGKSEISLQIEFGPHGDGVQDETSESGAPKINNNVIII